MTKENDGSSSTMAFEMVVGLLELLRSELPSEKVDKASEELSCIKREISPSSADLMIAAYLAINYFSTYGVDGTGGLGYWLEGDEKTPNFKDRIISFYKELSCDDPFDPNKIREIFEVFVKLCLGEEVKFEV